MKERISTSKFFTSVVLPIAIIGLVAGVSWLLANARTESNSPITAQAVRTTVPFTIPNTNISQSTVSVVNTTMSNATNPGVTFATLVPTNSVATTTGSSTVFVDTADEQQIQQLQVADTLVTVYMPESFKNEPSVQLIVSLTDQPAGKSFKNLTLYAEQQHSIVIVPALDYNQKNTQALTEKINNIVVQIQPVIHIKIKKQLAIFASSQHLPLAQAYIQLYPQNALGIIKTEGNNFVLNKTATTTADPQIGFGDGQ